MLLVFLCLSLFLSIPACKKKTPTEPDIPEILPTIEYFNAIPQSIASGESSTLSWKTKNATNAIIDQGIGTVPVTGTKDVSPEKTITYTLTAINTDGQKSQSCMVDVFYSCQFELTISHDASATGDFYVSLLESTPTGSPELMSLGVLDFSPLPDNPDVSEGTANFSATFPSVLSGTYVLCLYLVHYNDLEQYQVTPGEWVIEATISEGFEFVTGGVFTSVRYALVQVGRDTAWLTFSISK